VLSVYITDLKPEQVVGLVGAAATILVGVGTWLVSAWVASRNRKRRRLSYKLYYERVLPPHLKARAPDISFQFRGEDLAEPVLLSVNIKNAGNVAIVNPPIEIRAVGATYVIPGWIEDPPAGYEDHWDIERTDAESCALRISHINPGQVVRARFLLDEYPAHRPIVVCPMADVEIRCENPPPAPFAEFHY
jgi:hypothetical protein